MEHDVYVCEVISQTEIAPSVIDVRIRSEEIAKSAVPGQFLHIKCGDETAMPLRRPISICNVSGDEVRFIYQVKGKGTAALGDIGERIDVIAPLGSGFTIDNAAYKRPAVIGGGIGAYPLLFLTHRLSGASVYMGFKSKSLVTLEEDFKKAAARVSVATDDGSYGYHGFSIELLERDISAVRQSQSKRPRN